MITLCFIRKSFQIPQKVNLQNENPPSFLELPNEEDLFNDDLDGKYEVDTTISRSPSQSTKRVNEFFLSSVHIGADVIFSNNFAFGAGVATGSGGAVFVSYGTLTCVDSGVQFIENSASFGGAICSSYSGVFFSLCPLFQGNLAFRQGGAIYFYGANELQKQEEPHSQLYYYSGAILNIQGNGEFRENKASELGGAIAFWMSATCGVEYCHFEGNEAGLSGGAICAINCPLSLIQCEFKNNKAGSCEELRLHSNENRFAQPNRPNFNGRGGGAIYFSCDKYMYGYKNPIDDGTLYEHNEEYEYFTKNDMDSSITRQLYTDGCCYSGDTSSQGYTFGNGAGHEILLNGHVTWSSFNDYMQGYETIQGLVSNISNPLPNIKDIYIDSTPQRRPSMCHILLYNFNTNKTPSCKQDELSDPIPERIYSEITPIFEYSTSTISIALPTTFTYQATPITQIPYKTTSSYSQYTAPTFISPPTARTVARTIPRTAENTFAQTIENTMAPTLEYTIAPTIECTIAPTIEYTIAPTIEYTIAPTIIETPVSSPYETPIETPTNTFKATIDMTPVITLFQSPSVSNIIPIIPSYDPDDSSEISNPEEVIQSPSFVTTIAMTPIQTPSPPNSISASISEDVSDSSIYTETSTISTISTSTVINTEVYVEHTIISTISNSATYYITYENTYISFSYVSYYLTETMVRTYLLYDDSSLEEEVAAGLSSTLVIVISVLCAVFVFVIAGVFIILYRKRRYQHDDSTSQESSNKTLYEIHKEKGRNNDLYDDHENLDDPATLYPTVDNAAEMEFDNDQYIQQLYF